MAQEEKIEFGISSVHFFLMKNSLGKWTCEAPELVESCQSLTTEPVGDSEKIYADNKVWYIIKSGGKMKASLGFVRLLDEFRVKYMGAKKDASGGVWSVGNPDDIRIGVMFEANTDVKPNRYVLLNGSLGQEKREYKTLEDKTNVTTSSIEAEFEGVDIDGKRTCQAKIAPDDARYGTLFSKPFEIPAEFASDSEVA